MARAMDIDNVWLLGPPPISRDIASRDSVGSRMLEFLLQTPLCVWIISNQAVILPVVILVCSVVFCSNILDILLIGVLSFLPDDLRNILWDVLVILIPGPLLFWIDDKMSASTTKETRPTGRAGKSKALASALQIGPDGARTKRTTAYVEQIRALRTHKSAFPLGVRGLENSGNMCYRNSTLQGLSSLDAVSTYITEVLAVAACRGVPRESLPTVVGVSRLIGQLREVAGAQPVLTTDPVLDMFRPGIQEDAQEYLGCLADKMENELKRAGIMAARPSLVALLEGPVPEAPCAASATMERTESSHSASSRSSSSSGATVAAEPADTAAPGFRLPLETVVAERKCCTVCGYAESMRLDPTTFVTLNMPAAGSPGYKQDYSVEELLSLHCAAEVLEGVNCSNCTLRKIRAELEAERASAAPGSDSAALDARLAEINKALSSKTFDDETMLGKCKVQSGDYVRADKSRQVGFAVAPAALAIQVNRSAFGGLGGYGSKDKRSVGVSPTLDFSPWYLGGAQSAPLHSIDVAGLEGKDKKLVEELERQSRQARYVLRSAVMHSGNLNNGHYYAYRECRFDEMHAIKQAGTTASKKRRASDASDSDTSTAASSITEAGDCAPAANKRMVNDDNVVAVEKTEAENTWWLLSDSFRISRSDNAVFNQGELVYMLYYDRVYDDEHVTLSVKTAVVESTQDRKPVAAKSKVTEPSEDAKISESFKNTKATELLKDVKKPAEAQPDVSDFVYDMDDSDSDDDKPAPEPASKPAKPPAKESKVEQARKPDVLDFVYDLDDSDSDDDAKAAPKPKPAPAPVVEPVREATAEEMKEAAAREQLLLSRDRSSDDEADKGAKPASKPAKSSAKDTKDLKNSKDLKDHKVSRKSERVEKQVDDPDSDDDAKPADETVVEPAIEPTAEELKETASHK